MNTRFVFFALILLLSGIVIISFLSSSGMRFCSIHGDDAEISSEILFQSHCAKCHGSAGEGLAAYPDIRNRRFSKEDIKKIITRDIERYHRFPILMKLN